MVQKKEVEIDIESPAHHQTTSTSPEQSEGKSLIKCGYLKKEGGVVKTWKRRYFELKDKKLYYFVRKFGKKKGFFNTEGAEMKEAPERMKRFTFKISTTERVWYLQAGSEVEMFSWIDAIRDHGGAIERLPDVQASKNSNSVSSSDTGNEDDTDDSYSDEISSGSDTSERMTEGGNQCDYDSNNYGISGNEQQKNKGYYSPYVSKEVLWEQQNRQRKLEEYLKKEDEIEKKKKMDERKKVNLIQKFEDCLFEMGSDSDCEDKDLMAKKDMEDLEDDEIWDILSSSSQRIISRRRNAPKSKHPGAKSRKEDEDALNDFRDMFTFFCCRSEQLKKEDVEGMKRDTHKKKFFLGIDDSTEETTIAPSNRTTSYLEEAFQNVEIVNFGASNATNYCKFDINEIREEMKQYQEKSEESKCSTM